MMIRKKQGEADGWAVTVCLRSVFGWDDNSDPFQADKGVEYFTQGDLDPNIFELVEPEPKSKKVKLSEIKEEEI